MAPVLPSNYYPTVRYRASPAVASNPKPPSPWPPASASASAAATLPLPPPPPALVARPLPAFHTTFQMVPVADPSSSTAAAPPPGRNVNVKPPSPVPNYGSSGSHHDPTSVCLHAMVHEFLEEADPAAALDTTTASCGRVRCNCCTDRACSPSFVHEEGCGMNDEVESRELDAAVDDQFLPLERQLHEIVEGVALSNGSTVVESCLVADVKNAMEEMEMDNACTDGSITNSSNAVMGGVDGRVRRAVMKRLRRDGHNAAICKSRWSHGSGLPAGDYEYIDVIVNSADGKTDRYIVDIDFKAQFEIARASEQYRELMAALPRLFVGRPEHLKQIVKTMCASAKRSLKDQGLHLPPWRKQRYMLCKWFASYRRTTAPTSSRITPKSSEDDLLGLGLGLGFAHTQADLQPVVIKQEMDISFFKAQARAAATILSSCARAVSTKTGFDRDPHDAAAMEADLYGSKTVDALGKVSSRSGLSAALKLQNPGVVLQS